MTAQTEMQTRQTAKKKQVKRTPRVNAQLPISRALYRKFQRRARAERRTFSFWLATVAERELQRPPSI